MADLYTLPDNLRKMANIGGNVPIFPPDGVYSLPSNISPLLNSVVYDGIPQKKKQAGPKKSSWVSPAKPNNLIVDSMPNQQAQDFSSWGAPPSVNIPYAPPQNYAFNPANFADDVLTQMTIGAPKSNNSMVFNPNAIADDAISQILGTSDVQIPYRREAPDQPQMIDGMPVMPSKKTKRNTSKSTVTQTNQTTQPLPQIQEDQTLKQLADAYMAQKNAIGDNISDADFLRQKLADFNPTPSFKGLIDYANYAAGTNIQPDNTSTFGQRSNMLNSLNEEIKKGRVAQTSPDIDFLQKKIGMEREDKKLAQQSKEKEYDRQFREKMLAEQIRARQQENLIKFGSKPTKADTEFSKEYSKFVTTIQPQMAGDIDKLESSLASMEKIKNFSGGFKGFVGQSDTLNNLMYPEIAEIQRNINDVIMGTLRDKLGAQFTEQEGLRLQKLSYNPMAKPEVNIANLKSAISIIKNRYENRSKSFLDFENNGFSLRGLKPLKNLPSMNKPRDGSTLDFKKMSDEELKKYLSE